MRMREARIAKQKQKSVAQRKNWDGTALAAPTKHQLKQGEDREEKTLLAESRSGNAVCGCPLAEGARNARRTSKAATGSVTSRASLQHWRRVTGVGSLELRGTESRQPRTSRGAEAKLAGYSRHAGETCSVAASRVLGELGELGELAAHPVAETALDCRKESAPHAARGWVSSEATKTRLTPSGA
jgi:hypothetical protein